MGIECADFAPRNPDEPARARASLGLNAGPVLATLPSYLLGTWAGAALFGLASEETFRRATYAMIALAAVIALPLLDGWLRG